MVAHGESYEEIGRSVNTATKIRVRPAAGGSGFPPIQQRVRYQQQVHRVRIAALLSSLLLGAFGASSAGCRQMANASECDAVAKHLAELQVKKERTPPLGRLASPPFNGPNEEKEVFDEARDNARERCGKGWKKSVADCMIDAKDLAAADKCRFQ